TSCDLSKAQLGNNNMNQAMFSQANLTGLSFVGCDLTLTLFAESTLDNADFSGMQLAQTQFGQASLKGANFSQIQANSVSWVIADLTGADFSNARIEMSDLSHAKLGRSRATNAFFSLTPMVGVSAGDAVWDNGRIEFSDMS